MNDRPQPVEDRLAAWLEQYHQALQRGVNQPVPEEFASDPSTYAGLRKAMAGIEVLERVWPRDRVGTVAAETLATPTGSVSCDAPTRPSHFPATGRFHVPGFQVLERVGRGGMGLVYRARQLRLDREVALKVLPPGFAEDPERLERFRTEATAAARLNDAHVLPVLDLLDLDGTPVLVLPYVRGGDLGRILHDRAAQKQGRSADASEAEPHPWAALGDHEYLEKVLPLLDQLLAAVAAVHRAGVLHRDIKPSNVLLDLDGKLWLGDFGLARLGRQERLTTPGVGLGTPGYMSPEQWDGVEDIDGRTDVFALGVTLYQALTLELPYGKTRLKVNQSLPAAPSNRQPLLSADLDAVVLKALEPDRAHRYPSAAALCDDWERARQGQLPLARRVGPLRRLVRRVRRRPVAALAVLMLATLVGLLGALGWPRPAPATTRTVELLTEPAGARVVLVPLDENGELRPEQAVRPGKDQRTPLRLTVPPGDYLLVAGLDDGRFHEVYRRVPPIPLPQVREMLDCWKEMPDGAVRLDRIDIPPLDVEKDMAPFSGGQFWMGPYCELYKATSPRHKRQVAPFYLDQTEVTVEAYRKGGLKVPEKMRERHPGPPANLDQYPVAFVDFYRALQHAERVGKRLPTEAEFEFAATGGGELDYPWGNERQITAWPFGPVKEPAFDQTRTKPPVHGLYSNVAEWTDSLYTSYDPTRRSALPNYLDRRVIRGGPPCALQGRLPRDHECTLDSSPWLTARWRQQTQRSSTFATVGFRCARSKTPRFLDEGKTP